MMINEDIRRLAAKFEQTGANPELALELAIVTTDEIATALKPLIEQLARVEAMALLRKF